MNYLAIKVLHVYCLACIIYTNKTTVHFQHFPNTNFQQTNYNKFVSHIRFSGDGIESQNVCGGNVFQEALGYKISSCVGRSTHQHSTPWLQLDDLNGVSSKYITIHYLLNLYNFSPYFQGQCIIANEPLTDGYENNSLKFCPHQIFP